MCSEKFVTRLHRNSSDKGWLLGRVFFIVFKITEFQDTDALVVIKLFLRVTKLAKNISSSSD